MTEPYPTMLQLGPFSAWITMEDVHQGVHGVEVNGTEASCWIASEQGKKFSISWHNALRDESIEAKLIIDGVVCNRHVMLDAYNFPQKPNAISVSSARTSEFTRRDFVFSAVQITDDDAYLDTLGNSMEFGSIRIELWRLCVTAVRQQPLVHQYGGPVLESQTLHERSKKAGAHHVKFGEEYVTPIPVIDTIDGYKMDQRPLVAFNFRYRPLAILMANEIIPCPSSLKREQTADEIRHLERRIQSLRSSISAPKQGHSSLTTALPKRKNVKREECEVIDLT
ncbi:hypothetical protein C8J56DRAFT_466336 [Mycena floridula]|nr:hypothetical protein C8J56DRAFT_466336 [Mycena floridula]